MSAVNGPGRLVADMGPQCAYFREFRSNACGPVGQGPTGGEIAAHGRTSRHVGGFLADVGGPDAPADGRHAPEFHDRRVERTFTLPASVDANHVVATSGHGVLKLTPPLADTATPRRIAIGTGSDDTVETAA